MSNTLVNGLSYDPQRMLTYHVTRATPTTTLLYNLPALDTNDMIEQMVIDKIITATLQVFEGYIQDEIDDVVIDVPNIHHKLKSRIIREVSEEVESRVYENLDEDTGVAYGYDATNEILDFLSNHVAETTYYLNLIVGWVLLQIYSHATEVISIMRQNAIVITTVLVSRSPYHPNTALIECSVDPLVNNPREKYVHV